MFPFRSDHRLGESLLLLADALLAPSPTGDDRSAPDDADCPTPSDATADGCSAHRPASGPATIRTTAAVRASTPPAREVHPHAAGRRARIVRRRRPGAIPAPPQHCITPVVHDRGGDEPSWRGGRRTTAV